MAWARIDDNFADHPKVAALSDAAFRAHIVAICYSTRYLTDGVIPPSQAPPARIAKELVAGRVWETWHGGYRIHDWLDWNLSAADVQARRKTQRERMRRWRRGKDGRWSQGYGTHDDTRDDTGDETGA
jgi:hypothetical protein